MIPDQLARISIVLGACSAVFAQLPAGPFTAAQSTAGATSYQTNCSSCHAADLGGRNEAPPVSRI